MLKPWQKQQWCIPVVGSEFVWHMEDILDLYAQPKVPDVPRVCFDECPYQLLDDVREPWPPQPGKPKRQDGEYAREGMCNLFLFLALASRDEQDPRSFFWSEWYSVSRWKTGNTSGERDEEARDEWLRTFACSH